MWLLGLRYRGLRNSIESNAACGRHTVSVPSLSCLWEVLQAATRSPAVMRSWLHIQTTASTRISHHEISRPQNFPLYCLTYSCFLPQYLTRSWNKSTPLPVCLRPDLHPLTRYSISFHGAAPIDHLRCSHNPVTMPEDTSNATENAFEPDEVRPAWLVDLDSRSSPPGPSSCWSPPEDPDKPRLPYIPGLTLEIERHIPPPPFGESLRNNLSPRPLLPVNYLRGIPQSRAVVDNPPVETEPPARPEAARLVITAPICVGEVRGAQIVRCTISPKSTSSMSYEATAKIYDPLYYNFKEHLCHEPRDVMFEADWDYSNESAAYSHLDEVGQTGSSAPAYYGSWTFNLPITVDNTPHERPVRLILMEELNGSTILDTRIRNNPNIRSGDSFHFPQQYRLEILARAMDAFVRQLQFGIDQSDFAGRNVVLVQDNSKTQQTLETAGGLLLPRVVLIDYNNSVINQRSSYPPLPENPISVFWNVYFWEDFAGWAPNEWEDGESHKKWLLQRFYEDTRRQIYLPVHENIVEEIENGRETGC